MKRVIQNSIGVDLGGTNVRAGLVSGRKIVKFASQKVRAERSKADVFEDLCRVIDLVFQKNISGIGLGVPSLVNTDRGFILDTTNIKAWNRVPLRAWLARRYKLPIEINNDANCFALGENYFGTAISHNCFVGLILGTGLGAGIIANGKLVSGSFCGAGEFGVIPYKDSILEHYAAGGFFNRHGYDGESLHRLAVRGDRRALKIFAEFGHHLSFAIKLILYSVAPEQIVLGGSVSRSYRFFRASLAEGLKDFAYPILVKKLKIRPSRIENSAILGAASLIADASI